MRVVSSVVIFSVEEARLVAVGVVVVDDDDDLNG